MKERRILSDYPPVLTRAEAATLLRVSPDTVTRLLTSGELPAIRSGRTIRVAREQIARLLGLS